MRHTKTQSLLARIFLATLACFACAAPSPAERLPIKIYTSADGLGSSAAFNLVRDPRGFIWLCSRDGLVRFDGYRFTTYRVGDEFADPQVFKIVPDRSGRYWVNLNRGTDYRLIAQREDELVTPVANQPNTGDSRIPMAAEPLSETLLPFFEDSDGTLWTGDNKGLYVMKERADGKYDLEHLMPPLPGSPVEGLSYIAAGHAANGDGFWIGTHWGLVRRLRDGRMFHYSIKPENGQDLVRSVVEDKTGRLWIIRTASLIVMKTVDGMGAGPVSDITARVTAGRLTPDGIPVLPQNPGDAVEFSFTDLLRDNSSSTTHAPEVFRPEMQGIVAARDGKIWMATSHGLLMFDETRFRHYTTRHGLAASLISSMVEGSEGHIWMATYGGLHRLNPRGLTSYDEADGLERHRVHSIYRNAYGEMHVVTGNFNFAVRRGDSFVSVRPKIPAGEIALWQSNVALLDSRGDWWVITNKNLYRFTGIKRIEDLDGRAPDKTYNESNGLLAGANLRVFEDSEGNIWVSTFVDTKRRGLTRIDPATGRTTHLEAKDGLPQGATVTAAVEDAAGTLWFGLTEGGVGRYRNGKLTTLEIDALSGGGITDMFRDSKGHIWLASSRNGVTRVDDPSAERPEVKTYTIADGLASNNVRSIGEDRFGRIYIGTVRGIDRLNPETGQIKYYGTSDGLASDFTNVFHRDHEGTMWIGTLNGLSKLIPETDEPIVSSPVLISGLRIGDQDYSVSPLGQTEVFLPDQEPGSGSMQIDFLSLSAAETALMRYQYKLEGTDADWSKPTEERSVTLANLAPGSHGFLVRSLINGTVASERPAIVHFTVLRPVWQRWWFLLIVALAVSAAAYVFYRYRLAQLLKLERVRTRIATDLHDDIGSSLSQIAILSEVARHKAGENGAAEPLRRIADTSRDLVDSMSDIVWAINPHKDHLSDLIQRMRRFAEEMLDAKDIGYRFAVGDHVKDVALGADLRRETYLIFKECINNLVKYSAATEAQIEINIEDHTLSVKVSDNGRGFDVAQTMNGGADGFGGNGLPSMRRRAVNLGGDFSVESTRGAGTVVCLEVPIDK